MVLSDPHEIRLPPVKVSDDMPVSAHAAMRLLADLVAKCTAFQPDQRPTFTDILNVSRRLVFAVPGFQVALWVNLWESR